MKSMAVMAVCFVVATQMIVAQTNTNSNTTTSRVRYFSAKLPGGTYTVSLVSIVSISTHAYVVDGGMLVTEASIADTSSSIARFYFIEPFAPPVPTTVGQYTMDRLKQLSEEVPKTLGLDSSATNIVVKNYPVATHAHTVEYRMPTKESVEQLRKAAEEAFLGGTTKTFEVK